MHARFARVLHSGSSAQTLLHLLSAPDAKRLIGDSNAQRWSQHGDPIHAAAHSPLQCQRLPRCGGCRMVRLHGSVSGPRPAP